MNYLIVSIDQLLKDMFKNQVIYRSNYEALLEGINIEATLNILNEKIKLTF